MRGCGLRSRVFSVTGLEVNKKSGSNYKKQQSLVACVSGLASFLVNRSEAFFAFPLVAQKYSIQVSRKEIQQSNLNTKYPQDNN
jgi:hypothetical protein